MQRNRVHCIDALEGLDRLESNSIDMIMTSPPYWQAREYDGLGTIGFEKSPEMYVRNLQPYVRECLRVLKPTGGLWLNVGDSRSQGKKRQRGRRDTDEGRKGKNFSGWSSWDGDTKVIDVDHDIPPKSFMGIPERVMFMAMEEGFIVRNKIIWAKGAMRYDGATFGGTTPSSTKDNFAVCWEHVFYLTKSRFNYFNMEAAQIPAKSGGKKSPLNVWVVPPAAGRDSFRRKGQKNFATYPPALVDIAIRAGCPPWACKECGKPFPMSPNYKSFKRCDHGVIIASGMIPLQDINKYATMQLNKGIILDPFGGSGTTGYSAVKNGFDYMLFDISPEQVEYAKARIEYVRENL